MRIAGKINKTKLTFHATAENLIKCSLFNDEMQKFQAAIGFKRFFPKGVYIYKSQKEANDHWDSVIINKIVRKAK